MCVLLYAMEFLTSKQRKMSFLEQMWERSGEKGQMFVVLTDKFIREQKADVIVARLSKALGVAAFGTPLDN